MTTIDRYEPGTFCWIELSTSDRVAATRFYTQLFGWTTNETPLGGGAVYVMLQKNGRDVGALYEMFPQQREEGVPPFWMSYVAVESADEMAEKAKQLGATVMKDAFDVMDVGRMAVLTDPVGAVFSLWQAKNHPGAGVVNEPGALCWNELQAPDAEKAQQFYTALFGWTAKVSPGYVEFHRGDTAVGGMRPTEPGPPPHWLIYFAVDDTDATVQKSESAGGKTVVPPMDIEHVGRFAVMQDPQGASFAVIKLNM